jgi:hypothetical protein
MPVEPATPLERFIQEALEADRAIDDGGALLAEC